MQDPALRDLIESVRLGQLSRRSFIHRLVGLGLTAPMASMLLMNAGIAQTQTAPLYKGSKRGGGGSLKLLVWQGPVHLNPHFAGANKELFATRIFYEPLAGWDSDGNLIPMLAAETPSRANGGVSVDGRRVVWKLKRGVTWHDGKPFTADDVVFTWRYAGDPATATVTVGTYQDIVVEKVDAHTVRVTYPKPTPFWAEAFVGTVGMILPQHVFADFVGARSRETPANVKPVGTGPYKFLDFRPGDLLLAEAHLNYHVPLQPFFDKLELKGGGDSVSAARAVLQTGEYDYAWTLQVEDEILQRLEAGGKGKVHALPSGGVEFLLLNPTDPWKETEGERAHVSSRHPAFSDKAVRDAVALLIDRKGIQEVVYGRNGTATANLLNYPVQYRSTSTGFEFNIDKANLVLDAAGWKRGADGMRGKAEVKLKFVFQTSVGGPRQKTQSIIKSACAKAGIELELKAVTPAVFFGGDVANPDTTGKFWADMQMFTVAMNQPDPLTYMEQYTSWSVSQKANKWSSRNRSRWFSPEYDELHKAAQVELDAVKRAALFIRMNDLVIASGYVIPIVSPKGVKATANKLNVTFSSWDVDSWALGTWSRDA